MAFRHLRTYCVYVKLTTAVRTNPTSKAKTIDSELALTRESATSACILAETQRQAGQESFTKDQGKAQVRPNGRRRPGEAGSEQGILRDSLGEHIWISLLVLNWKRWQKLGKLSVINQVLGIWD